MTYREEIIGPHRLILGDCRELASEFVGTCSVVSDPPYGMNWNTDCTRFSGGDSASVMRRGIGGHDWMSAIVADDQPFDPAPWLEFSQCILWGANHFAARLPVGTTLVWLKRFDAAFETFLSDAEIAWMKGGHGVYCRRDLSMKGEALRQVHPTQKPVGIMSWCIEKTTGMVLDPFMGSGTTIVACQKLGRAGIGIEIEPKYFDIACRRVEQAMKQPDLFIETAPKPQQLSLMEAAE